MYMCICVYIYIYIYIYTYVYMWRYSQHASPTATRESFSQHLREIVKDHPRATRALDNIFAIPGL